jgi:acyl-coenzyme A thioesterase PaaI-like protein
LDLIFNKEWAYKLYVLLVVQRSTLPVYEKKNLSNDVIRPHLEFQGVSGRATFHVTREHTNSFGALHGGCHAMVMEQVATVYAQEELKADDVVLEAMQVDYLAAGKGSIDVECETLGRNNNASSKNLHVRVLLKRADGRILSDGKLRFLILSSRL